ncbi:hypothetical protein HID58_051529, partial [Brassica napus]
MWNFKSMTDDDPMKFGFGSPAIKDKEDYSYTHVSFPSLFHYLILL